ncbi:hypothetical protein FB451DRAFT_1266039 [Mycena latifolia]|nr:hypothetical protein FB451DRAFT_1266039 [Mycena latifolia]
MSPAVLSELAAELIFAIFAFCDISSVVSTGQTCRYLHDLAFQKSVWLVLLGDLQRRSILDSVYTPHLNNLSTDELMNLVKRLLSGPKTWNPLDSHRTLEVSKEIILRPGFPSGPGARPWENETKLLPSGRYLLFKNTDMLELWDVTEHRLVWTHTSQLSSSAWILLLQFTAEEIEGGESVVVMLCERSIPHDGEDRRNIVEIVAVNAHKGTHELLLLARVPGTFYENPFQSPVILGPLAVVSVDQNYLIIDWKARTSFVLAPSTKSWSRIALIPGHIILKTIIKVTDEGEKLYEIHIISTDALQTHLMPAIDMEGIDNFNTVSPDQITKLITLRDPDKWDSLDQISVHESPLHDSEYRIWVCGSTYCASPPSYNPSLWCYQLSIPVGQPPRWKLRGLYAPSESCDWDCDHTYSGHVIRNARIIGPGSKTESEDVELPRAGDFAQLAPHSGAITYNAQIAPYSGALTYPTDSSIVIQYFK